MQNVTLSSTKNYKIKHESYNLIFIGSCVAHFHLDFVQLLYLKINEKFIFMLKNTHEKSCVILNINDSYKQD